MLQKACDALLVDEAVDLYYLTGLQLSAGVLVVHAEGAHLLVDSRYYELAQKQASCDVVLTDKMPLPQFLATPLLGSIKTIGFDSDHTPYSRFQTWQETLGRTLVPLKHPLAHLRMIKDAEEVELLRQAAALGVQGYDFVCTLLKEGISEAEIALELELFWKRRGSRGLAFEPIIAFGANGSMPHYRAGSTILKKGTSVLIDIGVNLAHYHSDMTRVVYFGEPHPKIKEIYAIVAQAQEKALALCRPGVNIGELDAAARGYIAEKGYGEYFSHSLGHGVGLEIHEAPTLRNQPPFKDMKLEVGMVITIEPGIYLPGIGGVRLEDTVVITPQGHENLTS